MKNKSTNILYIYTARRSFVNNDIQLLEKHFKVTPYHFKTDNKKRTPLSFLRQLVYLLAAGWKYDSFVCFFAGYHSVLPSWFSKWTGKQCIIFLGGTDCFNYPSFRYGNFTKRWYAWATCFSAHRASMLVPVSHNLIESSSGYYTVDSTTQGIYHWCRPLDVPHKVIALEYNPSKFYPTAQHRNTNSFISVAFGIEGSSFVRKGIDKMIMIATQFPQFTFTIIGCEAKDFPVEIPSNVSVLPPVPYDELPAYYSRHEFYLQLSIAEGFPSAICEAMLCGCIPIGSDVAAIPEIIGNAGFIVRHRDDALILETIQQAVSYEQKESMAVAARQHIMDSFGEGRREKELFNLFRQTATPS